MKIVFMGTPDFAKESLEAIYNSKNEILAVVTNPDKPKGRGMKMIASPVKEFALEKKLKIFQPQKIRNNDEFIEEMQSLKPDLLCVVAYGKILPKDILEIPKYGAINVHGSILPKYRGAAPIQWAILNGEKTTGTTTIFMDEGMDSGDIILKKEVNIGADETTGELWQRLSKIGGELLVETIQKIESINQNKTLEEIKKALKVEKQGEDFTLAPMLKKEIAKIDWNKETSEIKNLIRGLNPIMGAYSTLEDKKIKIWKAKEMTIEELKQRFPELEEYEYRLKKIENGTILFADRKKGLFIKTKDGILEVLEIQEENSKKMDIKNFLNGSNIQAGQILE